MSESKNDLWLCYGDYVCLSTRAGRDTSEKKYILGHSSPLVQLKKIQKVQSSDSDFGSIVLAENPPTIAFSSKSEGSSEGSLDMITNARDYWFEVLPRTDYEISSQLINYKKQLSESKKKLENLEGKRKDILKKHQAKLQVAKDHATSTVALNSGSDIHMSSQPPNDAVVQVGEDTANGFEMQSLGPALKPVRVSLDEVKVTVGQTSASGAAKASATLSEIERAISALQTEIERDEARVADFKTKTKQEQAGNQDTIARMHGDPLNYGAVIQLVHVTSRRFLSFVKSQDRPVELSEYGKPGSLFYIERVSTGVAGGSAKIPALGDISVRLRSFVSDSHYVRMEPNISFVPGTKFGVALDVELDGVFNADESFQLGTGALSGGNRVDWIFERCKKNSSVLDVSAADVAEDDGISVHEVLSGCQIVRLYHRSSESYLAATATKIDRGKVFMNPRSQSDASQGSGKIANTYWMVIDGDGDMADSGENMDSDRPVILQHVVSGMVLVGVRHLPAFASFKATNDEEYLSDDEEFENTVDEEDEKQIKLKRDEVDKWLSIIRTSVVAVLEFCSGQILPTDPETNPSTLIDLCSEDKLHGAPFIDIDAAQSEDEKNRITTEFAEFAEYMYFENIRSDSLPEDRKNYAKTWMQRGHKVLKLLKDTVSFLSENSNLTVELMKIKELEIEYALQAWFNQPVFVIETEYFPSPYIRAIEVVKYALLNYKPDDEGPGDVSSQSGVSAGGGVSLSGTSAGYTASARSAPKHYASSVAPMTNASVAQGTPLPVGWVAHTDPASGKTFYAHAATGTSQWEFPPPESVISASHTLGNFCEAASHVLNDKSAAHPLETLRKIIALYQERGKKVKSMSDLENPWTLHVMTPKRLATFRGKLDDLFEALQDKASNFLMACRWSFSTKHNTSNLKEGNTHISNNTLFGIEAYDCKDSIFLLGSDQRRDFSRSTSTTGKHVNAEMVPIGPSPEKKGQPLEAMSLQCFEQQLYNVEFVSTKNSDKIRNGAQVSSIIRNFCAHLKFATEKRDLTDNDLDYYMAFVRRYYSRLTQALDVVARTCVVDGFEQNATSTEVDTQGQLFFGSLGVVELAFSVIQPLTQQLGWQIDEAPPMFTQWTVRLHHAKVLHYTLTATSAISPMFTKKKADEFFKRWRQRRDTDGNPWADAQMSVATFDDLEEMGFEPVKNDAGRDVFRVTHNLFYFFAACKKIIDETKTDLKWDDIHAGLQMPKRFPESGVPASPKSYANAVIQLHFPKLSEQMKIKKLQAIERNFNNAFDVSVKKEGDETDDKSKQEAGTASNEELLYALKHSMKPSDFDFFCKKYYEKEGLYAFKAIISPLQASRIKFRIPNMVVEPGEQMFYLLREKFRESHDEMVSFNDIFKDDFRATFESVIKDSKIIEFDKVKAQFLGDGFSRQIDEHLVMMMTHSRTHHFSILKHVALDDGNVDSPWNDLPIFFNFEDSFKYDDFRSKLIEIVRKACTCVQNLLNDCQQNAQKLTSSQIFYVIKNLFPKSSANQLNVANMISSILRGNFSAIDRMHTDAVYSSLLKSMNDSRSNAVPTILQSLVVNRDGTSDYGQQMRVLKYAFQNLYKEGRILIPRIPSSYVNNKFSSLLLVFDSTYSLDKTKSKPTPKDHPFGYISPPPWATVDGKVDGDKRLFVEPWDVLIPVTRRTGTLGKLYGEWCPPQSFELKIFAHDYDCLQDFEFFSAIKKVEQQWATVHSNPVSDGGVADEERELKRDWWYCTMKLHLQFLCSCYSLVAKLCSNRNQEAWNFFFGKKKQIKEEFFVQTWGSRSSTSIISQEDDDDDVGPTYCTKVAFGVDGFSTVAAVTNLKPMNPSCGYQVPFPSRRFMYYEVTIESFNGPEDNASLQLGWTLASKERNSDQPSDGNGVGDFDHSWGMDGVRSISYEIAQKMRAMYEKQLADAQETLRRQFPSAEGLKPALDDLRGPNLQVYIDKISVLLNEKCDLMRQGTVAESDISQIRKEVEKTKHILRSRFSHRTNIIEQMAIAKKKWDSKRGDEQKQSKLNSMSVDRGLMCFHNIGSDLGDTSCACTDGMQDALKTKVSLKWTAKSVIGVWFDSDACEIGIVRSDGVKQTAFRRSDTAFFEDLNSVHWKEDDIVPCISGRGVNIKINLGILGGEKFEFFDSEQLVFTEKPSSSVKSQVFEISEFKDGKIITPRPHILKNGQYVRFEFAKTGIVPELVLSSDHVDRHYMHKCHGLHHNQVVVFTAQGASSNAIEKDQPYIVDVRDDDSFSLLKVELKERLPYRVKLCKEDASNSFSILRTGIPDGTYISDPLQFPRVHLNGKVDRALWGPYGDTPADVTELYNRFYEEDGLRSIGNLEAIYERDGKMVKEDITNNMKHFFKPELVSIQATEHCAQTGVYTCENHGLKKGQFVQFCKQDQPNGIVLGQAYTVDLENGSENSQFRLVIFHQDEICFLKVYNALNLPNMTIGDGFWPKQDASGRAVNPFAVKAPATKERSLKFALCTAFAPPSRETAQEIPNFAFSNGLPVVPQYDKLSDIIFSSFLPACLRSSCVELLRSCFVDQEPWFLTPPINTVRAVSAEPSNPATKCSGGYPAEELNSYDYKVGKELPDLAGCCGYQEADVKFFDDVFDAAGWEQSEEKNPKNFGDKDWDSSQYKPRKIFLLHEYRYPKGRFELCTRDVAVFWGRSSCLLWEKSLKSRFLSEKNQDIKIFLKNLIYCLLDTLRYQFDESWLGIINVRKRIVKDMELCILTYFKQTQIAQIIADTLKKTQNLTSSDSSTATAADTPFTLSKFLSHFRRSELHVGLHEDDIVVAEEFVEHRYKSPVPEAVISDLRYVSDHASPYSAHSKSQGSNSPYSYFDWQNLNIKISEHKPSSFSSEQLKIMFSQASGDLLLGLCELLSVSWQIKIDDKISDILRVCDSWHQDSLHFTSNPSLFNRSESQFMGPAIEFFEQEQNTVSKIEGCSFIDQHGNERIATVDWFDVIPALASIPKTAIMASKLCIQLHSSPKDLFEKVNATQIITGQDSEVHNKLKVELRTLRVFKENIRSCFFSEDDLLGLSEIPNDVSCSLGESWKCVERLIAQLCLKKEYDDSTAEVQSWVKDIAARLFVPNNSDDPKFERIMDIVDDSGGMPLWEESLEYIEMLHDMVKAAPKDEQQYLKYNQKQSPFFIIRPRNDDTVNSILGFTWKEEMMVCCDAMLNEEEGADAIPDHSPCRIEYDCRICDGDGDGYCFCFRDDDDELVCVHPECVYEKNLFGDIEEDSREIPPGLEEHYKSLYENNKAGQDITWDNERRTLIVSEIKDAIPKESFLDCDTSAESAKKKEQLQKAMLQIGIVDQLIEIAKIRFPKKYSSDEAWDFNIIMKRRMKARRINYAFENVNATLDRVDIIECLMRRVFFLLALLASNCSSVQSHLFNHIDFFFSKALEPSANDSSLCILNIIQGNIANAMAVPVDLLASMVKVAQDGQYPDDILLLAPFLAQGDKNIFVNQREILELCIPAEFAVTESCMFVLDSDYPSQSSDKASFDQWKKRITSLHVSGIKSLYGENPWDQKEHNWKHLLRVASDLVHNGYASTSEPCRSAFHMAFIKTVNKCSFNNPEVRQNIVLRLPFVQILHILNTMCSVVCHRIWGQSFIERSRPFGMDKVNFTRDPRLNFLNFDLILKASSQTPMPISVFPLCGLLKFIKCYLDFVSEIHFFTESGSEDIARRTSEGLPLTTSSSKVSGFITWMGLIMRDVVSVFRYVKPQEVAVSSPAAEGLEPSDATGIGPEICEEPAGAGVSDSTGASVSDAVSESASNAAGAAPLLSMGALAIVSKFKVMAHSHFSARPFSYFDDMWYRDNGDVSLEDFDRDVSSAGYDQARCHPLISVALNQIWSNVFGLGVNFERKIMQGMKLSDKLAYDSRSKDLESRLLQPETEPTAKKKKQPKFCRPFWRCPISHYHFTNQNYSVLALAVSSVLFDEVPMEKTSKTAHSILGAIGKVSVGYSSASKKRPDVSDIAEAELFILAIELLIQEMCDDPNLRALDNAKSSYSADKQPTAALDAEKTADFLAEIEIKAPDVLNLLTKGYDRVLKTKSFARREEFKKHLHKNPDQIALSWPQKLSKSRNESVAVVLIEKKITHWNIIRLFRASMSDGNPLYSHVSASQAPVVRRCLSFALVYNWGGWGGVGSEIALRQLKVIIESIGVALSDICRIAVESFPLFIQQLFHRFEAPKAGSPQSKEYIDVGNLFLTLASHLKNHQADCLMKLYTKSTDTDSSPLDFLHNVGETLKQKVPKMWSAIAPLQTIADQRQPPPQRNSKRQSISMSIDPSPESRQVSIIQAHNNFLHHPKVEEIVSSTIDLNDKLVYRFLAIDIQDSNPVDEENLPFTFYSKQHLMNSTSRNEFPKHMNMMVYNLLSVLGSVNSLPRGDDTDQLVMSCLSTLTQVIFCGACVNKEETERQFTKLAKNKPALEQLDSESFFVRTGHLQECMVGLCWRFVKNENGKGKLQELSEVAKNPILVTDESYKVSLKAFSYIANLVTPASASNAIREKAIHVLSCMLDNCSIAVLDRFFDSKDAQIIHSTSNLFACSLQQFIKDYEIFKDRDDDLSIYLDLFRKSEYEKSQSSEVMTGGSTVHLPNASIDEDEFIRKLIEFETTDWLGAAHDAKLRKDLVIPRPDPIVKEAYNTFSAKNFTGCLYSLRLICQMCVQSGKTTRASYHAGQAYMVNQPNSDPALVVNFSAVLNSLGSAIAGRMRLAQANVFDIRILCRLFKAYNAIIFGAASSQTQQFLVAETFNLINKTISGLSQRIDDVKAPFFPNNHPINVLEQMLQFLLAFALSDINGSSCKKLSKSISWINFFNVISQVHLASAKYERESQSLSAGQSQKTQVISMLEYKNTAQRMCDSAYILFSAVKRRDILKSAHLEKDWLQANLETVALDAQRRVSCVEIVRTPGFAELCFFSNPDTENEVGDNTQRQLLCLEDSRQLSLRKNLVICEQLRNRKQSSSGSSALLFKVLRNVPLVLTLLINFLLLGWLNLPLDFSQAQDGWKWPQNELLWERLVPNVTSEDGSYSYEEFQTKLLPNVLPLFVSDETPEAIIHRNGINMTFLVLAGVNILVCFLNLVYWMWKKAPVDVYEYLLTSAYLQFSSPANKSKKKISLEDLRDSAGGKSYLTIFKIPSFWGRLVMFVCSLCILLVSPLFSVLFVCDGFRFPGISYIFGAFSAKSKEFFTLGYLTASIIFINAVIGLVFFWDLFAKGENDAGSSECTTLFQCTLSFIVLGWQGGGLSDLLTSAKDTPQGTPSQFGDPRPQSYRLIIALIWQLLYFIVVPTCLVSTVVGIISDSFGDARQKKAEWKDTMSQYCFVCGRSAADFRDAGLVAGLPESSIVTFDDHVTTEHCVKDYFKLFIGVKSNKNPDLLTAQEHFVLQKINSLDETFFPMDLSISLDAMKSFSVSEISEAEKQEKRMNDFDDKMAQVAESIEQVQEKMITQDDLKQMQQSMVAQTQNDLREILRQLQQLQSMSLEQKE